MEDPGENGAHPLGATSLNSVPGHQQEEKLVKLGDQPGVSGEGSYRRVWQGQDRWEGSPEWEEVFTPDPCSGLGVCPQALSRPTV